MPTTNTTYSVAITNQCGVVVTATVPIIVHPIPVITLTPQLITGCDNAQLTFTDTAAANANCTYAWNFGDNQTGTGNPVVHQYNYGSFFNVTVDVTSVYGCTGNGTTTANVTIYDSPVAGFEVETSEVTELEPTIQFENECSANTVGWLWDFGDNTTDNVPSPAHTYSATGTYNARLIATSNGGCTDTTSHTVEVTPEFTLYIPNAFTPNNDGVNDDFLAFGNEITDFRMEMFDRWGELIFTSNDIYKGWDGRSNGGSEISQNGVYVYKITVTDFRGKQHRYTGHVSLLK
jgi:gliding motility-associated-like protein